MNMMRLGSHGPATRSMPAPRSGIVAALDIGSSKVACFIARVEPARAGKTPQPVRVIGIGHQLSRGIRNGLIVDMDLAEEAIRLAVDSAERMAGITVRDVVVNLSAGKLRSQTLAVRAAIGGAEVEDDDLHRLVAHAQANFHPEGRLVIHSLPVSYTVDGCRGIRDPRGMLGEEVGVEIHMVSAQSGPLRNLQLCVERCHLTVVGVAASPYASGLSSLTEDEMELGACLVDMGGGTTTVSVFFEGSMVYGDSVAVGGNHITNDIAQGLNTPLADAERIKTLYGSALASPLDERELIDVPQIGESTDGIPNHLPRSILSGIIRPRLEETFEMVRDKLDESGYGRVAGRRVVLTGGASQLNGAREMAARVLEKQVRVGAPIRVMGLAEATGGPAFATCAGLLSYARMAPLELTGGGEPGPGSGANLRRFGRWLRENF